MKKLRDWGGWEIFIGCGCTIFPTLDIRRQDSRGEPVSRHPLMALMNYWHTALRGKINLYHLFKTQEITAHRKYKRTPSIYIDILFSGSGQ